MLKHLLIFHYLSSHSTMLACASMYCSANSANLFSSFNFLSLKM